MIIHLFCLFFFQFNHYVVSLAHHVVSLWFLSCKLPLRKNFVCYIVKGFKNNVLIPCEEGMTQIAQNQSASTQSSTADDSNTRSRSGSFSSHDARRGGGGASGGASATRPATDPSKTNQDETRIMFHRELMETCADLMSRYTYGNSAPYAQQSDTVGKILKVITIICCSNEYSRENLRFYSIHRLSGWSKSDVVDWT